MDSRLGDPSETLYLIDISSFIFRAFFAIRPLHTKAGEPVNAVYGVATMLARLNDDAKPEHLAVIYDSKEASFREEIYPEYKANRSETPEDLIPQFSRIEELVECFNMHSYRQSGIEADDLIATLTRRWCAEKPSHRVVVVSSDKDLMQLVNDRVQIWDTMSNKVYGSGEVLEKFGVHPHQIRDYLGLVGDTSDNIPGVPGVGPKTAAELLKQYENLEGILSAAKQGKISGKRGVTIAENEKDARLSAKLATVIEDLKVDLPFESLKYQFHVTSKCAQFLTSLDFHSLVKKWTAERPDSPSAPSSPAASEPKGALSPGQFLMINQPDQLDKILQEIEKTKEFGFDLETTSLNPREAEIVGIAICCSSEKAYYIPVGHRGTDVPQLDPQKVMAALKPYLENPRYKKVGQNLKYDFSVLAELGVTADGIGADTMVAAYVLSPEGRFNLEVLSAQYLNYPVTTYEQVCGKGKDQIGFDQVPIDQATHYSAEDAWVTRELWHHLKPLLEKEKLMDIFARVDLPLVQVLSRMERNGVCIDSDYLAQLAREFERDMMSIEQKIQTITGRPINLNSPKQLAHLLFEELKLPTQSKTKTGYSTDASVLEILAELHEVPRLLLDYREISKLKGTYVDPLPGLKDRKTGKIHASFHQAVTATGRLSSSDPNLQNIPIRSQRGQKIRRAFIASPGNVLVAADYSQIELRLLAHMSGDVELTNSFLKNEDVHRRTASEIFGVAPDKVDDRQRGIAKAINFGLMYGKSAFGLSQELRIPRKEAQETIDRYFQRYTGVKRYLDQAVLEAKEAGAVYTLLGRKRALPDIKSSNHAVRSNAERMAMNSPIQGTAADLMKLAMIEIDDELGRGGYRSKLTIQVHDEVVLDCPKEESKKVQEMITRVMEGAMKLSVPLVVNSAVADNWMDL